jgi:hypothetical protein
MSHAEVPATVLALPLSHLVQSLVPVAALEYFPAGHIAHVEASAEYFPGGHVMQVVAPNPDATPPTPQSVHVSVPLIDAENLPEGHIGQLLSDEKRPGAQELHSSAPGNIAALPLAHFVQLLAPEEENFPSGHMAQVAVSTE